MHVAFIGLNAVCPSCRTPVSILDGQYNGAGNRLVLWSGPASTIDLIQRLTRVLDGVRGIAKDVASERVILSNNKPELIPYAGVPIEISEEIANYPWKS
jgi:hypothetical protein